MAIAAKNPLGLRIPAPAEAKGKLLDQPKKVEAWIEHLPMASGTEMAKQLFRAIQDINRARIDPATRILIAELLTPSIEYAISTLGHKFLYTSFPLTEKARRTAFVCVRLHEELAFSYKLVVRDVSMRKIGHHERKILIIALLRSVRHLSDVIYQTTLTYESFPQHVWREQHNLFAFAESNRWASTQVKLKSESGTRVTSLRELYLQSLMFAAASPHRLRQRQIRTLNDKLPEWVAKIRISSTTEIITKDTCFVVQLKKDRPPIHASLVRKPISKPALELDTTDLIRFLQETLDAIPIEEEGLQSGIQQTDISVELLKRLIDAWGTTPKRRFVRTHLHFDLEIAVGLYPIHNRISGNKGTDQGANLFGSPEDDIIPPDLNNESTFSTSLVDSELTLVPIENSDYMYLQGYDTYGTPPPKKHRATSQIWQTDIIKEDSEQTNTAVLRTINESAEGYCVNWHGNDIPGITVGDLVSIHSVNNPSNHGLAIARWMHNEPGQGLQLGLQLIAHNTYAVLVFEVEPRKRTPTKCLLITELKSTGQPANLITPIMSFKIGDRLQIKHDDTEQAIRLTRMLESTGTFAQFQFEHE